MALRLARHDEASETIQIPEGRYKDAPCECSEHPSDFALSFLHGFSRGKRIQLKVSKTLAFLSEDDLSSCSTSCRALLISMTDGQCDTSPVKELLQRMTHYESELPCKRTGCKGFIKMVLWRYCARFFPERYTPITFHASVKCALRFIRANDNSSGTS